MRKLIFILMTICIYSCNKSQVIEPNKVEIVTTINDELTPNPSNMQTKPITYELIKDIPFKEVVKEYPPMLEETFILGKEGGFITEFRVGLLNIFKEEDIQNRDIKIKEITWEMDNKKNLTVWYNEKDAVRSPIDYFIWDKEAEF